MRLKVYKNSKNVPEHYHKHLKKLGLTHGCIRNEFFDDLNGHNRIHETVIIVNKDDVPVAWGLMCKGNGYLYKNAMFYTQRDYRRQGLALKIYNSMCQRHKKFVVYEDDRNHKFFKACGRRVYNYD